jgi:hypothetical protein
MVILHFHYCNLSFIYENTPLQVFIGSSFCGIMFPAHTIAKPVNFKISGQEQSKCASEYD